MTTEEQDYWTWKTVGRGSGLGALMMLATAIFVVGLLMSIEAGKLHGFDAIGLFLLGIVVSVFALFMFVGAAHAAGRS